MEIRMRKIFFLSIVFLPLAAYSFAATIHVPGDQPTIQAGVDAAVNGDTVLVAPGLYFKETVDFLGKAIIVKSSHGPELTIIRGFPVEYAHMVTFNKGEGADSVLEGFTVRNGNGYGGGGGILCEGSSPTIKNNIIFGNVGAGSGGGIACLDHSSPIITNNIISWNWTSSYGGGIFCNESSPTITNNIFFGNGSTDGGGGIDCQDSSPIITNNTLFMNVAGFLAGAISIQDESFPTVTNTILWDNGGTHGLPEIYVDSTSSVSVTHCDVDGGYPGAGNIDADPLFVDILSYDHHIYYDSPCRNAGTNSAPSIPDEDIDGNSRIAYGIADMGADEFCTHLYWIDDSMPYSDVELKFVGLPGSTPVGLCVGSGVLDPPIPSIWGDWYLKFPILGPLPMGTIPSTGILVVPCFIPVIPPVSYSIPMQALVGAELTNLCVIEVLL